MRGFTTLAWNPAGRFDEGDILFSGDTIIDRNCWGTQELVRAFCRRAGEWRAASGRRLFWFLISKGHRTYLYLPLFARRFHPHPEVVESEWEDLAEKVAVSMFGDCWKPAEGVIRFSASQGHLREELVTERAKNPWVRYFLERNPGHAGGEELVCLTEMDETNLRRGALAAFREGFLVMNPQAAALLGSLAPWSAAPGDAWARLRGLLEKQADSAFGRYHGFDSIRSPEDFREAIPAMDYEAHRSWIERCAGGEKRVLACEEPIGFERTSGTTSRAKWIPVTPGLQEEFARGLATWFGGWERRCPEVFAGRAYWAISPPGMIPEKASGGLPVGMTSDAAYFPDDVGGRLAEWLVMPGLSGEPESVFEETAEALLGTPDLSVVSVWSPTFLLGIDAVVRRLTGGRTWQEIWPKLALVSCWADASSAPWIPQLGERLGEVPIEAKGLLATEGITTRSRCAGWQSAPGDGVPLA